jgi:drug/metabolite transporter (DMT)-like permease
MYTAPIFVTIISRFVFKEKFTTLKIVCLSLAFIGTVLCSYDKNVGKVELPVFLVGLASGLAYASYSIFSKLAINKNVSAETILIYSFVFGMVASCFTVDFNHLFSIITKNNFNLINAVLLSVLSTVLPYTFYTLGLKKVESSKASIIACIEIVCATLVGLVAFNEFPSYFAIIGLVMVIGAIVLLNVFNITNKESNNDQT